MIRTQIATLIKLLAAITATLIFAHVPEQLATRDLSSSLSPSAIVSVSESAMVSAADHLKQAIRALI
jgi:hypothetical protein